MDKRVEFSKVVSLRLQVLVSITAITHMCSLLFLACLTLTEPAAAQVTVSAKAEGNHHAIVAEAPLMRVKVVPEWGGRIVSLIDKRLDRELVYFKDGLGGLLDERGEFTSTPFTFSISTDGGAIGQTVHRWRFLASGLIPNVRLRETGELVAEAAKKRPLIADGDAPALDFSFLDPVAEIAVDTNLPALAVRVRDVYEDFSELTQLTRWDTD